MNPVILAPFPRRTPARRLPGVAGTLAFLMGAALVVHALFLFDVGITVQEGVYAANFERVSTRQNLVTVGCALLVMGSLGLCAAHFSGENHPDIAEFRISQTEYSGSGSPSASDEGDPGQIRGTGPSSPG